MIVDAVGQHAGTLRLTNSAALNLTNGWLHLATQLEIGTGCTTLVSSAGTLTTSNLLNSGTLRLTGAATLTVSGTFTNTGTLDVLTWSEILPPGLVNTGTVLDRSLIKVSSSQLNGANFEAVIQGYAGHNFQLQYRDSITSGVWQNVGAAVPGAGVPITLVHTGGTTGQLRFYRVAVNP